MVWIILDKTVGCLPVGDEDIELMTWATQEEAEEYAEREINFPVVVDIGDPFP